MHNLIRLRGFARFCALVLSISLVSESTILLVKGSIEASSPEEKHENDSSLSGLIPSDSADPNAVVDFKALDASGLMPSAGATTPFSPYQPSILSAVVAAGLTMAVMSLKETGKIDLEGIGYILNSTDFYAGLTGSLVTSVTHRTTTKVIEAALSGAASSSGIFKPLLTSTTAKQVGNIVNGFTYIFAVSSSFEYFSQIWKHATKNIPEAQTMSGFLKLMKTDKIRANQVGHNLLYLLVLDKAMQKRILSSVYTHRILTFNFIATNVALYVGGQLGSIIANKYGAGSPLLKKIGPMIGSISGGLLVQAIPSSWSNVADAELLKWKLKAHRSRLEKDLKQIEEGVRNHFYPVDEHTTTGYWLRGADLQADIERTLRERDMIASLQLQELAYRGESKALLGDFGSTFDSVEGFFKILLDSVQTSRSKNIQDLVEKWISEKRDAQEIQRLQSRYVSGGGSTRYYEILLDAALARCQEARKDVRGLVEVIGRNKLGVSDLSVGFQR